MTGPIVLTVDTPLAAILGVPEGDYHLWPVGAGRCQCCEGRGGFSIPWRPCRHCGGCGDEPEET